MKKIYLLGGLFLTAISFAQVSEDFTFSGALNANGWTTHSGTAAQLTTSSSSLAYAGITNTGNKIALVAGNSEDVNKSVGTPMAGVIYYSTIVNFPNTTGLSTAGDYSMALGATAGASLTVLPARIYFKTGGAANTFNIGVLNNSGGTVSPTYVGNNYPVGTPIFVVVKYDRVANSASIFINPALNSAEPAATASNATGTGTAPATIASIALRQAGSAASGTGNVEFDTLRVADNWNAVTTGTLSTETFDNISGLRVSPNPATTELNITSDSFAAKTVEMYDVLGKLALKATVTSQVLNVSNLAKGVYVAKITEEGKVATRKVVIE